MNQYNDTCTIVMIILGLYYNLLLSSFRLVTMMIVAMVR